MILNRPRFEQCLLMYVLVSHIHIQKLYSLSMMHNSIDSTCTCTCTFKVMYICICYEYKTLSADLCLTV